MTLFDRIKAIRDISGENHWTRRFSAEMTYMSTLSSTKNGEYDARIAEAADYVLSKKAENGAVTKADVLEAEKMLEDLSAEAKKLKVICAAHAHIDMNWMWGYQETAAVTVDTFRTMLDLMNEYPEYKLTSAHPEQKPCCSTVSEKNRRRTQSSIRSISRKTVGQSRIPPTGRTPCLKLSALLWRRAE